MPTDAPDWQDMIEYRKKHFDCRIERPKFMEKGTDFVLSVTFNGHQWTPLGLTKQEAATIIKQLQQAIKPRYRKQCSDCGIKINASAKGKRNCPGCGGKLRKAHAD